MSRKGAIRVLLPALALAGLFAPAAIAAPQLELEMQRTSTPLNHGDERLVHELTVKNTAGVNPSPGDELTCNPVSWFGNPAPTIEVQWLRSGVPIAGTKEPMSGPATYVVTPEDAGKALQCRLSGTNEPEGGGEVQTALTISRPPIWVEPQPVPAAPNGANPPAFIELKAGVDEVGGQPGCQRPTGWTGTELDWSFEWLVDGEPGKGPELEETATTSKYEVVAADIPGMLQCKVTVKDAAGNEAVVLSPLIRLEPQPPSPYVSPTTTEPVTVSFANQTVGPVQVDVETPHSLETQIVRVFSEGGWSCAKQPPTAAEAAHATCTRSDPLQPGDSYAAVNVVTHVGNDAPDTLVTKANVSGGGSEPDSAEDEVTLGPAIPFGFESFGTEVLDDEGAEFKQAGGHPFEVGGGFELTSHELAEGNTEAERHYPNGLVRTVRTDVPPGFVGNPEAVAERCTSIDDAIAIPSTCPAGSVVGGITVVTNEGNFKDKPLYVMEPEAGTPAQLGFAIARLNLAFTLTAGLRPEDGYAVSLVSAPAAKFAKLISADLTLCGFGTAIGVSGETGETEFQGCRKASEPGSLERPFISLPTKCGDPASATTEIFADSWEGDFAQDSHTLSAPEGCESLEFEPSLKARPTTNRADSPAGLDFELTIPRDEDPEGTATAHLKKAVVTLPEGLVVNPSGANGLGACSEAQLGMANGVPDNEPVKCPDASKLGAVSVTTPILDHPLPGALYLATPHDNPFDSLIALYLVVESPDDGITIKLAGKAEANPVTGQLTTTFDQNPQAPVGRVELDLPGGALAPLRTPTACAKYKTVASLTPWSAPQSGPPATPSDSWTINRGPTGGACASPPNAPSFEAGSASAIAATHSPFVVKLRREDGTQRFSQVTLTPPPGLLAKLAGTVRCPDSALAQAQSKSGRSEQSSPSCPPGSELGNVIASAGAGPAPFQAPGKAYLAGPYKGAPLSIAILTPAVAGPFDLGTVVVRAAAYVNPATAQVTVKSDPLPQILQGIPLDIRAATVAIDRPGFILNPTSCDPMAVTGELVSTLGQSTPLSNRFQMAECSRLGFKPNLRLRLNGKTKRGDYQGLRATLTMKPGQANIASASVTLPRSAFLAQEHIRTVCTRVQFAADACPKGSIYGKAKAVTPLLDEPLAGPVYLRSSNNKLPDLVVALKGPESLPIEVELAGRTDSKKGALRNTFDLVPDAPVTRFDLRLFGGRKGLVVNSRNLCGGTQRAGVVMTAHNGKERSFRPLVRNGCGKKRNKKKGRGR